MTHALYLVPVPIGNLEDVTLRALHVLREADSIACEDTRSTGQLLKLLGLPHKRFISYHEHNEEERAGQIISEILAGASVALVSDAGSPCISDPGYRLVRRAVEKNVLIVPLPGPTAFVPALIASGLPVNEFLFMGFPPHKKGRQTFVQRALAQEQTVVLYESPYRIVRLLEELCALGGGERRLCVCRELTKVYEEFIRGTAAECHALLQERATQKGEFVLVMQGNGR